MDMRFDSLHVELLKLFRGKHSMLWLSKRLGYTHNQVYLWESGRRNFYWSDFEDLCARFDRPLAESIKHFYLPDGPSGIGPLLKQSLKGRSQKDAIEAFGVHPSKLSRWITGKSSPPFAEACEIIGHLRFDFLDFLDEVIGKGRCHAFQRELKNKSKVKRALYEREYLGALAPALELKSYQQLKQHRPGLLAKAIGITERQETEGLKLLAEAGVVYLQSGLYKLNAYRLNMTRDHSEFLKIADYWSRRAAAAKKIKGAKSLFGYRVFGISEEGRLKLRQALHHYYDEISEILKLEKDEFDHIVAIPFQTLVLSEN